MKIGKNGLGTNHLNDVGVLRAVCHDEGEFTSAVESVLEEFVRCDAFNVK